LFTVQTVLKYTQHESRQVHKVDSGLWLLADIQAWWLGKTGADPTIDMGAYCLLVRRALLSLPVTTDTNAMVPVEHLHQAWLHRAEVLISRVEPIVSKNIQVEMDNIYLM
jgi:hypothetical protein